MTGIYVITGVQRSTTVIYFKLESEVSGKLIPGFLNGVGVTIDICRLSDQIVRSCAILYHHFVSRGSVRNVSEGLISMCSEC